MRTFTPRSACTCCSEPMSYVFHRSSVQMMQLSGGAPVCGSVRLTSSVAILCFSSIGSSSGLLIAAGSRAFLPAWPDPSELGFFFLGPCRIVDLHARTVAQRPEDFITSGNDLVPFFQAVGYFDVRCSTDARCHRYENGFLFVLEDENSLKLFLGITLGQGSGLYRSLFGLLLRLQFAALPNG